MSGAVSYHAGKSAEDQVAQAYLATGQGIVARRWRGTAGEIDVIARDGDQVVFIEVKKIRTHAEAASHLSERQIERIWQTASEFLGTEPNGQDSLARFDVALVDSVGRIKIVQNAFAA
jgi:putative endonuclease